MNTDQLNNKLKVHTGVLTRSLKSLQTTFDEIVEERKRLQDMQDAGKKDRLRQQESVVNETISMVPNDILAIDKALNNLKKLVDDANKDPFVDAKLFDAAKQAIKNAEEDKATIEDRKKALGI